VLKRGLLPVGKNRRRTHFTDHSPSEGRPRRNWGGDFKATGEHESQGHYDIRLHELFRKGGSSPGDADKKKKKKKNGEKCMCRNVPGR